MKILITGGRGFLGSHLRQHLNGHQLAVMSRQATPALSNAQIITSNKQAAEFAPDVVINLAGASLFDQRWTSERKQEMYISRVDYTRDLLAELAKQDALPQVLISGSAVGIYGDCAQQIITESNDASNDWSAKLCRDWESQVLEYSRDSRVCIIRTGLVMHPSGGAMKPLMLPAKFGLLGPFGSGRNYWPWIAIDDWLTAVDWLINTPTAQGTFNLTAPTPVTQKAFMQRLSQTLKRPCFAMIPAPAARIMLGNDRAELLMSSQRAVPSRLLDAGFKFRYTEPESFFQRVV